MPDSVPILNPQPPYSIVPGADPDFVRMAVEVLNTSRYPEAKAQFLSSLNNRIRMMVRANMIRASIRKPNRAERRAAEKRNRGNRGRH
jgi:hypothetical protein